MERLPVNTYIKKEFAITSKKNKDRPEAKLQKLY